ncbi:MAG: toxin-antitoxin system HicB family antitoxin [Acidimicrobiales bacterium]
MGQLLTRLSDDLHERLRRRAREEGVTLNRLVTATLARLVDEPEQAVPADRRQAARERARHLGLLADDRPGRSLHSDRDRVVARTTGVGRAVSEALEADRGPR